jgi:hypothetical protein
MGLDTSHDCWHGAYSAFMRWRQALARAAKFPPLILMQGFYAPNGHRGLPTDALAWLAPADGGPACGDYRGPMIHHWITSFADELPISWEPFGDDPLVALLHHSDCEGSLPAAICGPLADRLEGLLPALDAMGDGWGHLEHVGDKTRTFIAGLRAASAAGEAVEFH